MAYPNDRRIDGGKRRAWFAAGIWLAVTIASIILYRWLEAPVGMTTSVPFLALVFLLLAFDAWLTTPAGARRVNKPPTPGVNSWMTARAVRLKRCLPMLFAVTLLVDLTQLTVALWAIPDLARGVAASGLCAVLAVLAVLAVWRSTRTVVELRIDAAGLFTPKWKTVVGWDKIEYAVQPARQGQSLRIMVGPEAAEGLSPALRANGGFLSLPLEAAGVSAHDALVALREARPTLVVAPWNSNGFVLAIKGATEVPDIASSSAERA